MAARTSKKSATAAAAATQGIMPTSTSGGLDEVGFVEGEDAATKSDSAPAAELAAAGTALHPGVTVTGQFNREDPATVAAVGALVQAAIAKRPEPPEGGAIVEREQLAAFEVRSNVLGSHGFVEAGGTVIVNRADFDALKAAGVIAGEWPDQEVSAG